MFMHAIFVRAQKGRAEIDGATAQPNSYPFRRMHQRSHLIQLAEAGSPLRGLLASAWAADRENNPRSANQGNEHYVVMHEIKKAWKLGASDSFGVRFVALSELIEEGKDLVGGQLIVFIIAVLWQKRSITTL